MIPIMAKDKADTSTERKRVTRSNRWDPDLLDAIAEYIADQDVPPNEAAVMEAAVREFLVKRGFWPRKAKGRPKSDSD